MAMALIGFVRPLAIKTGVSPIKLHIAVEGEQRVFGQWMKRSEKNARPQKSLGHGIALSPRFVGVAQEANRLKAARAIILVFLAATKERKRVESTVIPRMQQEITRGVGRNRAIARARKAGATLRAIGDAVGISKEWVRQIVVREL
jgi:hypothetical protein